MSKTRNPPSSTWLVRFSPSRWTTCAVRPCASAPSWRRWAPRKIAIDRDGFVLLPGVLAAWIRFVGRRRGIPEESIEQAVEAAYEHVPEMIELSEDPRVWGPAKTMALAIQRRGIDPTDQGALDDLVAEVNRTGGIDVLADTLAAPRRPAGHYCERSASDRR